MLMRAGSLGTDNISLGQATVVIDDIYGHREKKCDMIAVGLGVRIVLQKIFMDFVKKLGKMVGYAAFAAYIGNHHPALSDPFVIGAITSAACTSFKVNLGKGLHDFTTTTGHSIKTSLYTSSATLGASTTAYSSTNEITGTGYTATGVVCANVTPVASGTTAVYDWADAAWTSSTFTANGSNTYDDTASGDLSLFIIAFGGDQSVTAGNFTIQWPTADASNAIIRIA